MGLVITATKAKELAAGIWELELPPYEIGLLGKPTQSIGAVSALLMKNCQFDKDHQHLQFEISDVVPLNVGTTSRTIAFLAGTNTEIYSMAKEHRVTEEIVGPGDRHFLEMAKRELSSKMYEVSQALLRGIRARSAGDLKKGLNRNYSETPDNFWYVIIQPRVDELSITVRGHTDHFEGVSALEIKDDRGNTRFKVRNLNDVQPALKLIFHALRKSR